MARSITYKYLPEDKVLLPPPDAKVATTACDYCIVACGYKVYTWPLGREGGPKASQNALKVNFPAGINTGKWISPNMHNVVHVDGEPHHALVVPDGDSKVVNVGGNHSIRGGALAQKCFNPNKPSQERLLSPMMRVRGTLQAISWDTAFEVMAGVSRHVLDRYGEHAWAMKTYSYQYFENTYAISKLAFGSIRTPAYAPHDKPGPGPDTPGLDWAGIDAFSASYEDWGAAEVIYFAGVDPWETKSVLFTTWIMHGKNPDKKLIFALPRKTTGVAWGEQRGGLFLPVIPGTDAVVQLAITRLILEKGWEDKAFIEKWIANQWEIDTGMGRGPRNTPVEWFTTWGRYGIDFAGYKKWILGYKYAELKTASEISGVPADLIRKAAEMLARPRPDGSRPKTSFMLEKGIYWCNNLGNTTSFSAMGLICGAGNRPGQMISRGGGHQRGWMGGAGYPMGLSPEKFPGRRKKEIDLDRWVVDGKLRFAWVIGTTWVQAMAGSQELMDSFEKMTRGNPHQIKSFDPKAAVETLKKRVDSGGMLVVDQDIYRVAPIGTEYADLVLPAATWGEEDFTRCNGERRLRLYSKFYDAPGEAQPDWWIIGGFARKMGFEGFDWKDSNDVFEEAARHGRGGVLNYHPLVVKAKQDGKRAHDLLREYGTEGIQTPIRMVGGKLVGTQRLHDTTLQLGPPEGPTVHPKWLTQFNSHSGKAVLMRSYWEDFQDFFEAVKPTGDELWVTNGRINEMWQSGFDDMRRPYIMQRWPYEFIEIHPDDARARGIESGDLVAIENDNVLVQTGGYLGVDDNDLSFTELRKAGHIKTSTGSFTAVAIVTDAVRKGVTFANFIWPSAPANSVVPRVPDPVTNRYRFKLGKGRIARIGESPYKRSFTSMTFAPRPIA
ncbi:MAG: arsenite oxidase large subunit [Candidatus Rokubacteria bacterium GWA2_70_23]|nr:MAG: arsenite oxidase large subunit [Candidatus Rokubacteria bacterium GWA2_70_23]